METRVIHPSELKSYRKGAKLTQAQLAEEAGVTQAYIAKIESGKADPTVSTLEKITRIIRLHSTNDELTAEKMMTDPIISAKPNDKIRKAIELMDSHEISQMPVIRKNRQIGSVTEKVILSKAKNKRDVESIGGRKVKEVMEEPFPMVSGETDLNTLVHLLEHNQAVLILERGSIEGIITKADILKFSTNG